MHTIAGVGDMTTHGGKVITGSHTRKIRGKQIARQGDLCSCPLHGTKQIVHVLPIMPKTDGRFTAHSGAMTSCGAKIIIAPHTDVEGPVQ